MPSTKAPHAPSTHHRSSSTIHHSEDDAALHQQSASALTSAKRNFAYFLHPGATNQPTRLRTRAFLRTTRYITQFIFWRLVRWAKFAAVGALVAAVSATALGSMISGVAWIAAPPTLGMGVMASVIWGVGKFAARRLHRRWKVEGGDQGVEARERMEDSPVRREGSYGMDVGPGVTPW